MTGELLCFYSAFSYAGNHPGDWSYALPNSWNFTFSYHYLLAVVMLLYLPRKTIFILINFIVLIVSINYVIIVILISSISTNVSSHVWTEKENFRTICSSKNRKSSLIYFSYFILLMMILMSKYS